MMPTDPQNPNPNEQDALVDAEAEAAALSCIMRGGGGVRAQAETLLNPEMFSHHRGVADVIWELLGDGTRPDAATLRSEGVNPTPLENARVAPQNYERFFTRVREAFQRRLVVVAADRAIERAMSGSGDPMDRLESELIEIARRMQTAQIRPTKDLVRLAIESIEGRQDDEITGVPTPFTVLNHMTKGYQPSDLIVECARPSHGKTARAIQEALHCAQHHGPAAVISLEMTDQNLIERCLALDAQINLRTPLKDTEWQRLARAAGKISEVPLHVVDMPGATVQQIRGVLRRLYHEEGITAAWIDYLNQITEPDNGRSRSENYGLMTRDLRVCARELEIPIILLHQLNRGVERRSPPRPQASDLRGSGEIEENADVVICQWLPDKYSITHLPQHGPSDRGGNVDGLCEIIIDKQRRGEVGSFWLEFKPEHTRFSNLSQAPDHPPISSYNPDDFEDDTTPF